MQNTNERIISQIHLIRHGITEGNQKNWYYGKTDLPLADEGVDQLTALARERIYPCVDLVLQQGEDCPDLYTSGMLRTEQTFFLIYGLAPHKVLEEFKEMDFGAFECHSHEELKELASYKEWISNEDADIAPPKGESKGHFQNRIIQGFEVLCALHSLKELSHRHSKLPAHSIMVCHGGSIGMIIYSLFPEKDKTLFDFIPEPGHGYSLTMGEKGPIGFTKF